ncbi:MAG: Glu/Leu/Phe/Val dehydrogenase dimerization domain-containing protein, partial [Thermoanaerobaculia bacterium]
LRLARGMTYKAAISGVDLGGGKSVVIGDPRTQKTPALLRAMGRFIDSLGGLYIAGQDIGTDSHDMAVIRGVTRHVSCVNESADGAGDPSHITAHGVLAGMGAVLEATTGSDSLEGRRVAVQGVGHVGYVVARLCHEAGAGVIVSDLSETATHRAAETLGAEVVDPDAIYDVECDLFSPCSVGAVVNDDTIPRFRCPGIAGGANNVLAEPRHGVALMERGIVYGPDYLVNAGGLIRCHEEVLGCDTSDERMRQAVGHIYEQTREVIRMSRERGIATAEAADRLAEQRIEQARAGGERDGI